MDILQDIVSNFYQQQQNLTVVNDNKIVTTTVTTATAVFIYYVIRNMTTNRNKNDPTTPTVPYRWPIIGSSAEYFKDKKKFAKEKTELYGPVFRVHLLGQVRDI